MTILMLGTNLGEKEKHLEDAKRHLGSMVGPIIKESPVYQTEPWGLRNQPDFLNQIILLETELPPQEVMKCILNVEKEMGRVRSSKKYASRIIDIDIIFYKDLVLNSKNLTLPHPMLHKRRFVLVPLADMIPGFIHPVLGKSVEQLLIECPDMSEVTLYGKGIGSGE